MPLFTKKLNTGVKEFEKGLLKFGLVALFFVLGLFGVFSDVFAGSEDFESYATGTELIPDVDYWVDTLYSTPDNWAIIKSSPIHTGVRSASLNEILSAGSYGIQYYFWENEDLSVGSLDLWFRTNWVSGSGDGLGFTLGASSTSILTGQLEIGYPLASHGQIKYRSNTSYFVLGTYTGNTYFNLKMEWEVNEGATTSQIRYQLNDEGWTNWVGSPVGEVGSPNRVNFVYHRWLNQKHWYIDDFSIAEVCSSATCGVCGTYYTCQNVGCCWYYSTWLHKNYCVSCPTGECGSSFYECQNCLTQGTCEAEETCYWFNGLCKFGLGECGEGFDCQFCNTSSICATANCYWFDNFCWQFEPATTTSWFDYYSEYGDYPTSSAFVNQMASTTAIVFGSIGSFLAGFVEAFDTSEALAQGSNFGSAIPKMRGYLAIFNNFFGELPVAQAFLFLISFLLAVGLFRLIRNLIALFKFW